MASVPPPARAAATIRSASARVAANGFSTIKCAPLGATRATQSACVAALGHNKTTSGLVAAKHACSSVKIWSSRNPKFFRAPSIRSR